MAGEKYIPRKYTPTDSNDLIKITNAINILLVNDAYLLSNNCSERSVSHKLAQYLSVLYPNYDVDCEYNSNIQRKNDNKRKTISILADEYRKLSAARHRQIRDFEDDRGYIEVAVFPDIIIHKRGTNTDNAVIIELKKSGASRSEIAYDQEKLKRYTDIGCDFNYPVGYLITLPTGDAATKVITIEIYKTGMQPETVSIVTNCVPTKQI